MVFISTIHICSFNLRNFPSTQLKVYCFNSLMWIAPSVLEKPRIFVKLALQKNHKNQRQSRSFVLLCFVMAKKCCLDGCKWHDKLSIVFVLNKYASIFKKNYNHSHKFPWSYNFFLYWTIQTSLFFSCGTWHFCQFVIYSFLSFYCTCLHIFRSVFVALTTIVGG